MTGSTVAGYDCLTRYHIVPHVIYGQARQSSSSPGQNPAGGERTAARYGYASPIGGVDIRKYSGALGPSLSRWPCGSDCSGRALCTCWPLRTCRPLCTCRPLRTDRPLWTCWPLQAYWSLWSFLIPGELCLGRFAGFYSIVDQVDTPVTAAVAGIDRAI